MVLVTQHPLFSPGFFKESLLHFRDWLDTLFSESFAACLDADILIESPSTMAGIHVAEALGIPYVSPFESSRRSCTDGSVWTVPRVHDALDGDVCVPACFCI